MFQLNEDEWATLISQSVISNEGRGGRRKLPYVFGEHGILMLSSVLNSPS
ncbi:ORF6N domain-containing protein [Pedobacter sp. HMWF019]|nr:ORF6N domain-containing protein [Pedobacter sp. HMWF019]